jgi:hypothetical protein
MPPKNLRLSKHDHSLESSCGALSDGTITFLIQPISGKIAFSEFFSVNNEFALSKVG